MEGSNVLARRIWSWCKAARRRWHGDLLNQPPCVAPAQITILRQQVAAGTARLDQRCDGLILALTDTLAEVRECVDARNATVVEAVQTQLSALRITWEQRERSLGEELSALRALIATQPEVIKAGVAEVCSLQTLDLQDRMHMQSASLFARIEAGMADDLAAVDSSDAEAAILRLAPIEPLRRAAG